MQKRRMQNLLLFCIRPFLVSDLVCPIGKILLGSVCFEDFAGYARVSTDSDEQFTSYEAQVEYYTNYIKSNPRWEFVGVYTEMLTTSLIQMHPTCTQIAP